MTVRKTMFALPASALLLAACGGNDSAPPPDDAVGAGIANLLTTGGSWTMTGTGATVTSTLETFTVVSGGTSASATQAIDRDPSSATIAVTGRNF